MAQSKLAKKLTVKQYAEKINETWRSSVKGIIGTGRLLIEAKDALKIGEWRELSEDLVDFSKGTVSKLMTIASDPRLTKVSHAKLLPPSWNTLYQLAQLDDKAFKKAMDMGTIKPDMERSEVTALVEKSKPKSKIDKVNATDAEVVDDDDDDGEEEETTEPPRKRSEPAPQPLKKGPVVQKTSFEVAFDNFDSALDSLAEFGEKLEEAYDQSERGIEIDDEVITRIKNLGAFLIRFAKKIG